MSLPYDTHRCNGVTVPTASGIDGFRDDCLTCERRLDHPKLKRLWWMSPPDHTPCPSYIPHKESNQ